MYIPVQLSTNTLSILDGIFSSIITSEENTDDLTYQLLDMLNLEECSGFYFVFMDILNRLRVMKQTYANSNLKITDNVFTNYLKANVESLVLDDRVNFPAIEEELEIQSRTSDSIQDLQKVLYRYCMLKYKSIKEMNTPIEESILNLDNLYLSLTKDYTLTSARYSIQCLEEELKFGKFKFTGIEGSKQIVDYFREQMKKLDSIKSGLTLGVTSYDSTESIREVVTRSYTNDIPVCDFGFPPLDSLTSVYNGDIINLVATEGAGKTNYLCNIAAKEIINGYTVVYMSGESGDSKILCMILSSFIVEKTGYEIGWEEISYIINKQSGNDTSLIDDKYSNIPQDYYSIVNECMNDLVTNTQYGKLITKSMFSYENFLEEAVSIISSNSGRRFGHIFIDHSDALSKNKSGTMHEAVGALYKDIIQLKNKTGVCCFLATHTSSDAEKAIQAGKETGVRIGATNSGTSKDADTLILFETTPALDRQGLIKVIVKKIRRIDRTLIQPFIVKKNFLACRFDYDPEYQKILGVSQESKLELGMNDLDLYDSENLAD